MKFAVTDRKKFEEQKEDVCKALQTRLLSSNELGSNLNLDKKFDLLREELILRCISSRTKGEDKRLAEIVELWSHYNETKAKAEEIITSIKVAKNSKQLKSCLCNANS